MKNYLIALGLLFAVSDAKAYLSVDLNEVCDNHDGDPEKFQAYMVNGTELRFSQKGLDKLCDTPKAKKKEKDWNLNVYFGPFLAFYNQTELTISKDGQEAQLSHVNPQQRHSMAYYDVTRYKKWSTENNPAQMFDEPQNKLTVEYQSVKNAFSIGIEYVHPKIIFMNDENREDVEMKNPEVLKNMGTEDQQKYMAVIATSKSNVIINLYLNKRFELVNIKDKFKIEYIAAAGIGIHGSESMFEVRNENWERYKADNKWNVQGFTGNVQNKIEFSVPKARLSLRVGHDLYFIRYNGAEDGMRMKGNVWGQYVGAQLGFKLFK